MGLVLLKEVTNWKSLGNSRLKKADYITPELFTHVTLHFILRTKQFM